MKYTLLLIMVFCSLQLVHAQHLGVYQQGTVVRMRMTECTFPSHGFLAAFGTPQVPTAEVCPEYTLVSDKVVFVIVGRSSNQFIPLADVIDFRFQKNELAVRVDDAKHESKFNIKEMILRSEWDLVQKHIKDQLNTPTHAADRMLTVETR
jgi:hypothetical protein